MQAAFIYDCTPYLVQMCALEASLHFTGKERDTESGNDYFGARYYASSMGRFMSPDWSGATVPVPYANLSDPQTLNLYEYVRNNPLSGLDPDGHNWFTDFLNGLANASVVSH
jgi:RHS repeat-associated protein